MNIDNIFSRYINAARTYENTFAAMLKTMEPSLSDDVIRQLPQNIYLYAQDIMNKLDLTKGRETYITAHKLFGNKFLTNYMDMAVEDFKTNPNGSVDLLSPKEQEAFYGQVYEGVIAGLTSNPKLLFNILGLPQDGNIRLTGKGLGTERHPGDIRMSLYDFELNKVVDLGSYIEVKYSEDYMQTIAKSYRQSTDRFASTDQVWEQIEEEIQKGLETSLSADYSTGWMENEELYSAVVAGSLKKSRDDLDKRDIKTELENIEKYIRDTTPKVLIYIFSSKGIWLSELLQELQPIVKTNAQYIIRNKKYGINKKRLWYSQY